MMVRIGKLGREKVCKQVGSNAQSTSYVILKGGGGGGERSGQRLRRGGLGRDNVMTVI